MFLRRRSYFEKCSKILFLPIEIYSREFHAKLYLAYQASNRGWTVIIGPEYDLNSIVEYLPEGVYYGIGFHNKASKISKKIKKSGHVVVLQDEEGLVRWSPEFYKEYKVNSEINNFSDYFLCWGKKHKEIIQSAFKNPVKAIAIGNPRIDILNKNLRKLFAKDANEIKKDYGDFVLVNGNFGSANHVNGEEYLLNELKSRNWMDTFNKKEFHLNRIKFQKKIFEKMIELSIAMAKSGHKVVVRPHPSENLDVWKELTKNYSKKIKIIRSGNVLPWLMASKLIIHNGCTTAIEGLLLGKTIISYQPYKYSGAESLPNDISISFENKKDILKYLNDFEINKFDIKEGTLDILEDHIKKNESDDSALRILDLIENLPIRRKISIIELIKKNFFIEVARMKLMIIRAIFKKKFIYSERKCPKLDLIDVKENMSIFFGEKNEDCNKMKMFNLTKYSLVICNKLN